MEDHYVRVYTPQGEALLLMRMSGRGARRPLHRRREVHWSWWIARAAIDRIEGGGRQLRLRTVNGLEVPVRAAAAGGAQGPALALAPMPIGPQR